MMVFDIYANDSSRLPLPPLAVADTRAARNAFKLTQNVEILLFLLSPFALVFGIGLVVAAVAGFPFALGLAIYFFFLLVAVIVLVAASLVLYWLGLFAIVPSANSGSVCFIQVAESNAALCRGCLVFVLFICHVITAGGGLRLQSPVRRINQDFPL